MNLQNMHHAFSLLFLSNYVYEKRSSLYMIAEFLKFEGRIDAKKKILRKNNILFTTPIFIFIVQ